MQHEKGQFQGEGGLQLFYQGWRPEAETKAALIIAHGLGEHSGRYANVVNHLIPRGYAIYGYDLRGHGRSPGKRGHINSWGEYRADAHAFLRMVREQQPDRPLFLMGHSLGSLIALEYTLRDSGAAEWVQGVVSSGTALSTEGFSPLLLMISRVLSRVLPALGIKTGLDATALSRNPAVVQAYQDDPLVHGVGTPRMATESMAAIEWTLGHAANWNLPLLLLHGVADRLAPIGPSRTFFDQVSIADKRMIEYPGGYHEPHNDTNHEQATADLEQWLAQHITGGS